MYDCLWEKEMHKPVPEEQERRQWKGKQKRDVNVVKTCREREEREALTPQRGFYMMTTFISLQSLSVSPCRHSSALTPKGLSSHACAPWFTFIVTQWIDNDELLNSFCSIKLVFGYSLTLCFHTLYYVKYQKVKYCFTSKGPASESYLRKSTEILSEKKYS